MRQHWGASVEKAKKIPQHAYKSYCDITNPDGWKFSQQNDWTKPRGSPRGPPPSKVDISESEWWLNGLNMGLNCLNTTTMLLRPLDGTVVFPTLDWLCFVLIHYAQYNQLSK